MSCNMLNVKWHTKHTKRFWNILKCMVSFSSGLKRFLLLRLSFYGKALNLLRKLQESRTWWIAPPGSSSWQLSCHWSCVVFKSVFCQIQRVSFLLGAMTELCFPFSGYGSNHSSSEPLFTKVTSMRGRVGLRLHNHKQSPRKIYTLLFISPLFLCDTGKLAQVAKNLPTFKTIWKIHI